MEIKDGENSCIKITEGTKDFYFIIIYGVITIELLSVKRT